MFDETLNAIIIEAEEVCRQAGFHHADGSVTIDDMKKFLGETN